MALIGSGTMFVYDDSASPNNTGYKAGQFGSISGSTTPPVTITELTSQTAAGGNTTLKTSPRIGTLPSVWVRIGGRALDELGWNGSYYFSVNGLALQNYYNQTVEWEMFDTKPESRGYAEDFVQLSFVPTKPTSMACSGDGKIVYVVDTDSNNFYRSTDGGNTFPYSWPASGSHVAACSDDGSVLYLMVASSSTLYKSVDFGVTFTSHNTGAVSVRGISCSADGTTVYLADSPSGRVYKSTNSAGSFSQLSFDFGFSLRDVACSDNGQILYVIEAENGVLYRSTNGGSSFTSRGGNKGYVPNLTACSGDGEVVYIIEASMWYRSFNAGVNFEFLGRQVGGILENFDCSSDGSTVYAPAFSNDGLYKSSLPSYRIFAKTDGTQQEPTEVNVYNGSTFDSGSFVWVKVSGVYVQYWSA